MKLRDFESKISAMPIFNLNDIRKMDPNFHRQQLSYWKASGYIKALAGGYYYMASKSIDEAFLFTVANRMYQPSYVSLESTLAYYSVIPESVLGVTSISSRKTKLYTTDWGSFRYRSVKPQYMFGYEVIEINDHYKYMIASLEKAVLDYLYLNTGIRSTADFIEFRWNKERLQFLQETSVFWEYLDIFNKKALQYRVEILMEYINA